MGSSHSWAILITSIVQFGIHNLHFVFLSSGKISFQLRWIILCEKFFFQKNAIPKYPKWTSLKWEQNSFGYIWDVPKFKIFFIWVHLSYHFCAVNYQDRLILTREEIIASQKIAPFRANARLIFLLIWVHMWCTLKQFSL